MLKETKEADDNFMRKPFTRCAKHLHKVCKASAQSVQGLCTTVKYAELR